jgi:hypothetical protein
MVLKRVIGLIFAGGLIFSAAAADFVIRIAPPRVVAQRRDRAPGPGYVWVQGYQSYNGQGYAWVPGRWEQPPRPGARWVAHKWNHQKNGNWVMAEGHWR